MSDQPRHLTHATGAPVSNNFNIQIAGRRVPVRIAMKSFELGSDGDTSVRTASSSRRKGEPARQRLDRMLDIALEHSFPCSDPISSLRFDR
ncbi:MAG TPA: hypothetical protein VGD75_22330 [Bradyrhizobium sp.]